MTGLGETEEKDGLVTVCMASQAMLCSAFLFPQDGSGVPLLWKQSSQTATAPKGLFCIFISLLTSLPFHLVQQGAECQPAMWVSEGAWPGSALPRLTD